MSEDRMDYRQINSLNELKLDHWYWWREGPDDPLPSLPVFHNKMAAHVPHVMDGEYAGPIPTLKEIKELEQRLENANTRVKKLASCLTDSEKKIEELKIDRSKWIAANEKLQTQRNTQKYHISIYQGEIDRLKEIIQKTPDVSPPVLTSMQEDRYKNNL